MNIFREPKKLQKWCRARKAAGAKIALVPTMGYLHEGHISLITAAKRRKADEIVVSVFVNPTQFNDPKDLERYPRTLEADTRLLAAAGCDMTFAPTVGEMYPEGVRRPGHFNGVAQIVSKLFDAVQPDRAYFGEKDFQQLAIIRNMVAQYNYPVEIVPCPIVREADGLAMSSRNTLLNASQRAAAPLIYHTLAAARALQNDMGIAELKDFVTAQINRSSELEVEYFEIVGAEDLQPVTTREEGKALQGCIAVQAGAIRLIDNIAF